MMGQQIDQERVPQQFGANWKRPKEKEKKNPKK
jgi:hypothetical protein